VWGRQSVWSQTANRLKAQLFRARTLALALTVIGAVAALAGSQLLPVHRLCGQLLMFVAAVAVELAPVVGRWTGAGPVSEWVRARSVSEAVKTELHLFLTGSGRYVGPDREGRLTEEVDRLEADATPLLPHILGVTATVRQLPAVSDVESYLRVRVTPQIEDYYRPQALLQRRRLHQGRQVEVLLAVLAVLLAAAAAVWRVSNLGAWVAVVTTVVAAVAAHAAAQRYEYLQVEYERTARELERLRDRRHTLTGPTGGPLTDSELVQRCEDVISVQNQGWMARWGSDESTS